MLISEMEVKGKYTLPVNQSECSKDFYVVYAKDAYGECLKFKIPRLKFQRKETDLPQQLDCIVKDIKNGIPVIGQDIAPIIARFYKTGEEYQFRVKDDLTAKNGYYEVEDDRGLYFRLLDKNRLFIGQSIKCKVTGIKDILVHLKLTSQKSRANYTTKYLSLDQLLKKVDKNEISRSAAFAREHFYTHPQLELAVEEHDSQKPEWIFTTLRILNENITQYLALADSYDSHVIPGLELVKDVALYILEGSDYLKQFGQEERPLRQKFLNDIIQDIKHYLQALDIIKKGKHTQYLNEMLANLQHSGYLYHPNKHFRIMMTIFKIEPRLVTQYMGKIFNALREWDVANWRNEPFRSAFVEQLEMFITATRHRLDEMQSIESQDDSLVFGQMVKAIAIQTLIANDNDGIDINRNRSMLYRYLSLTDKAGRNILWHKALYSVVDTNRFPIEYNWIDTQQEIVIKTKASASKDGYEIDSNTIKSYIGNRCKISISDDGIKLAALPEKNAATQVLPNGLFAWPEMKVFLPNGVNTPNANKKNNFKALQTMWSDIERSLFAEAKKAPEMTKTIPEIGDCVFIHIDDIEISEDKTRLHCVIADSDPDFHGQGWMNIKDIVKYSANPSISDFCNRDGRPLTFKAKILGRNIDDELSFTMTDIVNEIIKDGVGYGTTSICVVTDQRNRQWSAISEDGYSLWIENGSDYSDIKVGDFVEVMVTHVYSMDKINGNITGNMAWSTFDNNEPFQNLMWNISVDEPDTDDIDDTDEGVQIKEETLSAGQVVEIIQLLRRLAVANEEYIQSYNLLAMARLFALTIDEKHLADNLHTHMQMLRLLKTYSDTNALKEQDLQPFESIVLNEEQPLLIRLYTKLKIISCIGNSSNESLAYLWSKVNKPHNEIERRLAQMALSHNMLDGKAFDAQRTAITKQMRELLNVNTNDTSAKFYGSESQTIEFKTSIVFPPGNHMRADIKTQTTEIMQEICAFLNSTGGTLFLGVNDSGYASGLDADMQFELFNNNRDKYTRHIYDSIANTMGNTAGQNVSIAVDEESADRLVYRIDIKPCNKPMTVNGETYQRQGSSVRHLTGEDLEYFIQNRAQQLRDLKAVEDSNREQEKVTAAETEESKTVEIETTATVSKPTALPTGNSQPDDNGNTILTSRTRNNALHHYQDDYHDVTNYLYFVDSDKYFHSSKDRWMDDDRSCRLSLAVHSNEKSGQLVLIYDDGHVVRVSMREIFEKAEDIQHLHNNEKELLWACPSASADDYLLMIVTDERGNLFYRANKLSEFNLESINSYGSRLYETAIGHIVAADIVPASLITHFEKGAKWHWRQPGYALKAQADTIEGNQIIDKLLSPLKG